MTDIYLIRHAEAEGNLYRRAHGQYDSNLTTLGRRQLVPLAERFRNIPIDALYSSDLVRTQSTASAIVKHHPDLTIRTTPLLREIGVGVWEDQPWGDLSRDWPEQMELFSRDPDRFHVPGSERFADVVSRMERVLTDIARENDGKTVAVLSHGMAIRATLVHWMGIPSAEVMRVPHGDNTAVHLLHYDNGAFTIEYYNDNSHLGEELSTFARQVWWRKTGGGNEDVDNARFEPLDLATDAALYNECYADTWRTSHGDLAGYNESVYLAMARAHSAQDPQLLMQMRCGDSFVGLIELDRERGAREKAGWISLIYCREAFRDRRLGIQLLGHAVSYFRRMGFEKIRLHVSQTNETAIGFYENSGFIRRERVEGVGGDLWLMEMDIRPRIWCLP